MELADKIAIVTGAAGGIGGAVAHALAARGAHVYAADLADAEPVAAAIRARGGRAAAAALDVTRPDRIRELAARAQAEQGGIDILVTAAGITGFGAAATLTEEQWDRIQDINLKGVFFCCQSVIEPMRRRGGGRIVNIGSILGKNGGNARPWLDPDEQQRSSNISYGAAKAGVHALTFYLARELASSGITVNAVAPGPIASAMTSGFPEALRRIIPLNRMGTAEEVAAAVAFLAGGSASFITGEVLDVNGGMWAD